MKSFWQNLRPQERRLVVIVGMVIFILLNMWFVWPYFGDWGKVQADLQKNRSTLDRFQREIARRPQYEKRQAELETTGSEMLSSETEFQRIISGQASATGVQLGSITATRSSNVKTNQFFQEGAFSVQFTAGGKELIDFLVGIAAQNAMIRVRNMNIRTADASQTKLGGNILFVGNYQRPSTNANAAASSGSTARGSKAAKTATPSSVKPVTPAATPTKSKTPPTKTPAPPAKGGPKHRNT
jgi:type II secretory pathway component PulM